MESRLDPTWRTCVIDLKTVDERVYTDKNGSKILNMDGGFYERKTYSSTVGEFPDCNILIFSLNNLINIPSLPLNLTRFSCSQNNLESLPDLPQTLVFLCCFDNLLESLPELPPGLLELNCSRNKLESLPELPSPLKKLSCELNKLASLPSLPGSLVTLKCYCNKLVSLPSLPGSLETLNCCNNELVQLPDLPGSLMTLKCYINKLVSVPSLPLCLTTFECNQNMLVSLPELPPCLQTFTYLNWQGHSEKEGNLLMVPRVPAGIRHFIHVNIVVFGRKFQIWAGPEQVNRLWAFQENVLWATSSLVKRGVPVDLIKLVFSVFIPFTAN